jgi:creatinine amidohydrolase
VRFSLPGVRIRGDVGGVKMLHRGTLVFATALMGAMSLLVTARAQTQAKLSPKWEELTAADFRRGIEQSKATCVLPFGILEKHGAHLPLGTDLLNVRYASLQAVAQEYAVVFPEYYFGQIFEAKHEPGTVAYSLELQLKLLQETTDEMARNGCKKVLVVNGHGGNEHLLPLFGQAQMDKPHDYVVYVLDGERSKPGGPGKKSTGIDYHAGENETSNTMVSRPDLVHLDRAATESGADQKRVNLPEDVYTGIWWYARFPNHYSGDGSVATKELGDWNMKNWIEAIVEAIRAAKADDQSLKIQNEFYERSKHPLDTRP